MVGEQDFNKRYQKTMSAIALSMGALFIFAVILLVFSLLQVDDTVNFASATALLIFIWLFDAALKAILKFDNHTVLSDLSLASLAFMASYLVYRFTLEPLIRVIDSAAKVEELGLSGDFFQHVISTFSSNVILILFIVTLVLWILNLGASNIVMLSENEPIQEVKHKRFFAWVASASLAGVSVAVALSPYYVSQLYQKGIELLESLGKLLR